ncbi:MAG: 50S ribosomal protein L19e [Candidatus Kariarchaeaceae archaeon]|jgi:large subunit ribosomal protein L19e
MTNLRSQRRIASSILKKGKNGVWMDPEKGFKVALAVTREDVEKLIHDGVVKPRREIGTSKGRARMQKFKRARGQRRGPGSRKGTANARSNKKELWMNKIRAQRKYLRKLRDEGYISSGSYRNLYNQSKGNLFRSVRFLSNHIRESGLSLKRIPEGR